MRSQTSDQNQKLTFMLLCVTCSAVWMPWMVSLCLWTLSSPPSSSTVHCVCLSPCLFSLVSLGQLLSLFLVFLDGGIFGSQLLRVMLLSLHLSGVSLRRRRVCVFEKLCQSFLVHQIRSSPPPPRSQLYWEVIDILHCISLRSQRLIWCVCILWKDCHIPLLTPPSCHCKYPFLVIWDPLVLATFKYITIQCC